MTPRAPWLLLGLVACAGSERPRPVTAAEGQPSATAVEASCGPDLPEVVAEIGGTPISRDELFAAAPGELIEAEMALSQARKDALEGLIMQRLVEAEAAKRSQTPEAFVQAEVMSQSRPVTDAEIEAFYNENRGRIQGSLDEVRQQIGGYLDQQRTTTILRAMVDRLKAENAVKVHLQPFRVAVAPGNGPRWGTAEAPVQIVEFSDFQCPYCSDAAKTVSKVKEKYGDKVAIEYRHYPLPFHGQAHRAAQASACANELGEFWKFHDALFAEQKPWTDDDFRGYAKNIGLDEKKFDECLQSGRHAATVDADLEAGKGIGMGGTPGFYVNGVVVSGAQPLEVFVELIDAELARLGG